MFVNDSLAKGFILLHRSLILSALALTFISASSFAALGSSDELSLRAKGGMSFLSSDRVKEAFGYGGDFRFGILDRFGIGATFSQTSGSHIDGPTNLKRNVTFMGINPYFGVNKTGFSASIGAIVGAMLKNESLTILNPYPGAGSSLEASSSNVALGLNATFDIPIAGSLFFTFVPEYLQELGSKGGNDAAVASIRGGLGIDL